MTKKKYIVKHKYSVIEGKTPSPSALTEAEIAINSYAGNEKLFIKNSSGDVISFDRIIVDDHLDSGSTNVPQTKVVKEELDKKSDWEHTIVSGESGFDTVTGEMVVDFNNRSGHTLYELIIPQIKKYVKGDNIKITSGSTPSDDYVISVSGASAISSSSTEVVQSKAIYNELDKKADWVSAVTSGNVVTSESAHTLSYLNRSGDTLFDIEIPRDEDRIYEAGRGIKITSGTSADTIAFDLPIYSGSGANSIIIGNGNYSEASGNRSVAEGDGTKARSFNAHAEGEYTIADGQQSHAEGTNTRANGHSSHAEGEGTVANNRGEHASGRYNISRSDSSPSETTVFTVGNGENNFSSGELRHNAFEVRQNGDIYIADTNASGAFYEKPMIKLQDAIGGDSVKGDENTIHTEINQDEDKVVSSLVYVKKVTENLPETVKERYQLVGADGNPYTTASGNTSANIDIYKDSHIVSITYISDSGDTHYQNLEYTYIDASGVTQTTYIDISEIILEAEVGDGLEVNNHIIKGKIDNASEKVITSYNADGTSATTGNVLTVSQDGFKVDNIQDAINAVRHGNLIDMSGFTSGITEDLFGIVASDTVTAAVKKIEDKLYKDADTGIIFDESSDTIIYLIGGTY